MTEIKITRPSKTIKLARPIPIGPKSIGEIEIKEPSGGLYTRLGEPRVMVYNASGSGYWVEQAQTVEAYLVELVQVPADPSLADAVRGLMSLEDMMAVKETFFSFFDEAARRLHARRQTSSSSASAS